MPEAKLIFPEFQKTSLSLLLQFLYTGEVGKLRCCQIVTRRLSRLILELQSGSSVLVEFQELCKILKVNPKVIKNRNEDGYEQPGRSSSYNWKCGACGRILSSRTKYIFHRQQCRKVQSKPSLSDESGFRSGASSSSTKKSAAESYALTQKIQKIPAGGEGPSGSSSKSSSKAVVKKSSASDKFEEAGGFRMPDNYDLPDYVIQEKFAKGESSTPLPAKTKPAPKPQTGKKGQYHEGSSAFVKKSSQKSSTKKNEPTSKPSSSLTTNERATPSSLSVAAELAAKKERMLMKLKGDRGGPSTSGGAADYVRQKPTTAKRKSDSGSSRDRVSRMSGKKKKKYDEEDEEDAFWSSSSESDASLPNDPEDDDSFQGSQGRPRRARRERQQYKEYLYDSSFEIYKNDKKIRVSAQVEGNETILELSQYKFQLLHKDDGASSSDEVEACKDAVPKEIHDEVTDEIDAVDKKSLAKHGKRILMMAGESSSSEEEEIPSQRDHDHQDKPKVEVKAVKDSIGGPSSQSNKNKSGNESSASSEKKMLPSEPAAATS